MKRILLYIILCAAGLPVLAQTTFTVHPPRNVIAGNKFNITFRLSNGQGSSLKVGNIDGCTLLYGPSVSTSQSYQVINGQATSSSTVDYSYIYRADKEGEYTIPEATIVVDGKTLRTDPVKFKVLPADKNAGGNGGSGVRVDDVSTQTPDREISKDDIFVRIILSKQHAYEQEAIECTIKLYTKYQSISSFMTTTPPSFDGFLIDEINQQAQLNDIEHYNGQNYVTAILKKCIIFPQKSGKLTITSGKYDITVQQLERVSNGFFITTRPVEKEVHLQPYSATIEIMPLPSPKPAAFNGAVGQFNIESRLNASSFRTNEAASVSYIITGTGNIKYIKEPAIQLPVEFEQYTPKTDVRTRITGSNVSGTVTVEYTFVPQSVGNFTIPAEEFVYFNPAKKEYVTLTTDPYSITVDKGVSSVSSTVVQQDITAKVNDILHIKTGDKHQSHDHTPVIKTPWFWFIWLVLTAMTVAGIFIYRKQMKLNADVTGRKIAKASKVARRRLKTAKDYMEARKNDRFYEEILRALWGYISDKLNIPVSELSRGNVSEQLSRYGVSDDVIAKTIGVLDQCEMARYTPDASLMAPEDIYSSTSDIMNSMERIKR